MNELARELNQILDHSSAAALLSEVGRRMYFPKGIVAQAAEAAQRAHRYDVTVGMAYADGLPMALPVVLEFFEGLTAKEIVAYAPTAGLAELRDLWAQEIRSKNPSLGNLPFTRPAVVPGLTGGLSMVSALFLDPGDRVVVPDMFWGNYRLMMEERHGAVLTTYPLFTEETDRGAFNLDAFEKALNAAPGKAVVLFNFPNNPTGYSPNAAEVQELAAIVKRRAEAGHPVLVVADDAYFGLFYEDGVSRESIFSAMANLHEQVLAVKVDGATKEEFLWGFRIGFITLAGKGLEMEALTALETKIAGTIRSMVSNSSMPAQSVLMRLLRDPDYPAQKAEFNDRLHRRYLKVRSILAEKRTPELLPLPFNSGYFMSFRCVGIDAEDLRQKLLDEGIGTINIRGSYLRVAFAGADEENLEDLYEQVFAAARSLAG